MRKNWFMRKELINTNVLILLILYFADGLMLGFLIGLDTF